MREVIEFPQEIINGSLEPRLTKIIGGKENEKT